VVDQTTVDDDGEAIPLIALDELDAHITPFTLSDVTLFVSTATTLQTVDAMRGGTETLINIGYDSVSEIGIRSDGVLFAYAGVPGSGTTAGRFGVLDSGTGAESGFANDGITDPQTATEINIGPDQAGGRQVAVTTFALAEERLQSPPQATVTGTVRLQQTVQEPDPDFEPPDDDPDAPPTTIDVEVTGDWTFTADADGNLTFTPGLVDPRVVGEPTAIGSSIDFIDGVVTINWTPNIDPADVQITTITYTFSDQSLATDEVDAFAWRRTGTATYDRLFYSVRDPALGQSVLFTARPDTFSAEFADGQPWGLTGEIIDPTGAVTLGFTTGMAFVGNDLYGVDTTGHLFTIDVTTGEAGNIVQIDGAPDFQGLANGPQNLESGRYADLLFAIDAAGDIRAFDTAGTLQTVFDAVDAAGDPGSDGIADAAIIPSGVAGATGLTFSPLDVNLWHPTPRRGGDAGHGINPAPDGSRAPEAGGTSMRFGFDDINDLHGVVSDTWQADLAANPEIGVNYNLPGGAYGSLTTNPFSLEGYAYTDKPTLYFNYFLNTENARGTAGDQLMRDSARVLVSIDGGVTWGLLATNNFDVGGELPGFTSVSSRMSPAPNQRVQELFDTTNWRQARIDLGDFAGLPDIRLRFDFSTAGMFDPDQFWAASTTVAADVAADPLVTVDSTVSLAPGLYVFADAVPLGTTVTEVDPDANTVTLSTAVTLTTGDSLTFRRAATVREVAAATTTDQLTLTDASGLKPDLFMVGDGVPPGTSVVDIAPDPLDPETLIVTLSAAVTLDAGDPVAFFSVLNDIVEDVFNPEDPATANLTGNFNTAERGQNNDFEGFYVDDIIIGFAERGEMVTAADAAATDFFDIGTPDEPTQVLRGGYQLEIRGASRDVAAGRTILPTGALPRTFDTNAQLTPALGRLGDANHPREQGQFIIDSNTIAAAAAYGISIDAAERDPLTGAPRPGVARMLPTINNGRLAPGAVVVNNLVTDSGIAGIRFSGDPNTADGPLAVVPFGRIVNNTIYGGNQPGGIGIEVSENAAPTLLNNLFANLDSGITVDGTSRADAAGNLRTVIGTSSYFNVETMVPGGVSQTWAMILTTNPFVDAPAGNFYPAAGSRVIDSGIDVLQDRNEFLVVNSPLGISPAPIISPALDLRGQLRSDDPAQASLPGLGNSVYKDRGAIDRADFLQPFATLVVPSDGSDRDADPLPDAVRLDRDEARGFTRFELQLNDYGAGINPATVLAEAFNLSRDGTLLAEGEDFFFRYIDTSKRVVFESAAVFAPAAYRITATTRSAGPDAFGVMQSGLLTDFANNPLLANQVDGTISFDILLADVPGTPIALSARPSDEQATLTWSAPLANGRPITRYEVQQREVGDPTWTDAGGPALTATVLTVTGLTNGTAHEFRARAHNDLGPGPWAALAQPTTPRITLLLELAGDTGASSTDAITNNDEVNVRNIPDGAAWEFSTDGGVNWQPGVGGSFQLPEGSYPAGAVLSRYTLGGITSETSENFVTWVIDGTPPVAAIVAVADGNDPNASLLPDGSTTSRTTLVISGTSEPDSTVTILNGVATFAQVTADATGNWVVTQTGLADDIYSLAVAAVDTAGNVGPTSSPALTITIDTTSPDAPAVTTIADAGGVIPIDGVTRGGGLSITGTAEPGVSVTVSSGGITLGQVVADPAGDWDLANVQLAEGSYEIVASATDAAGNTSGLSSPAYRISVDATPPGAPSITSVTDDAGSLVGLVPRGGSTDDTTPTLAGRSEAGSTVEIRSGGVLLGSTVADGSGNWSISLAQLDEGNYIFVATSRDAVGNANPVSSLPYPVTIDTTAAAAPVISGVLDNRAPITGNVPSGGSTNDSTLTISGTAEPGGRITVSSGGTLIGSTTATASGVWSLSTAVLAEGNYAFTATSSDSAGNQSPASSPAYDVIIDTTRPATPLITDVVDDTGTFTGSLVAGSVTDDSTPTISGTADPGSTVSLSSNGTLLGSTTADQSGAWTFTPASALADGDYSFTASAADAAGNTNASSPTAFPITIDTRPPSAVRITAVRDDVLPDIRNIPDGGMTNDPTLGVSGIAEAGSTVVLSSGGVSLGTVVADSLGAWSLTTAPLADGSYSLTATATDPAGNSTPPSESHAVVVDTIAPDAAVISAVTTAGGAIASGDTVADPGISFAGTAEPGSSITLRNAGSVVATASADAAGDWTVTNLRLDDGSYAFTATASDAAGNIAPASDPPFLFTVDATPPAAPVVQAVTDDVGTVTGLVTRGSRTDDATPTISGTAEPNVTVRVLAGGVVLDSTQANETGLWSVSPSVLADGDYEFTAVAVDEFGNESSASSPPYAVTIDTTAAAAPVISGVLDNRAPITGNVPNGGSTNDSTLTISGTAEPGGRITVSSGGTLIGSTRANSSGEWSVSTIVLADGTYSLTAITTAGGADSLPSAVYTFTVDTTRPATPLITDVVDDTGTITGSLVAGSVTDDSTPTISGTAEAGVTVTIIEGSTLLGSTTADQSGAWTFTPASALADGDYSFTASATDAAGNTNASSPTAFPITIDTRPPLAPRITSVVDDLAPGTGNVANGGSTDDATLTISGTAEPGSTVTLSTGDVATANALGAWSLTTAPLADGSYSLTATATDRAGNTGAASSPVFELTVVTAAAALTMPEITTLNNDLSGGSTGSGLSLEGTAAAGETVAIWENSTLLGEAVADSSGLWGMKLPMNSAGNTMYLMASTGTLGTNQYVESPVTTVNPSDAAPSQLSPDIYGPPLPVGYRYSIVDQGLSLLSVNVAFDVFTITPTGFTVTSRSRISSSESVHVIRRLRPIPGRATVAAEPKISPVHNSLDLTLFSQADLDRLVASRPESSKPKPGMRIDHEPERT